MWRDWCSSCLSSSWVAQLVEGSKKFKVQNETWELHFKTIGGQRSTVEFRLARLKQLQLVSKSVLDNQNQIPSTALRCVFLYMFITWFYSHSIKFKHDSHDSVFFPGQKKPSPRLLSMPRLEEMSLGSQALPLPRGTELRATFGSFQCWAASGRNFRNFQDILELSAQRTWWLEDSLNIIDRKNMEQLVCLVYMIKNWKRGWQCLLSGTVPICHVFTNHLDSFGVPLEDTWYANDIPMFKCILSTQTVCWA